jgi:hypothetical protein
MTDKSEKLLDWSLKGHLPGCQFHFAPLDTCNCTQIRMQDRIDELEEALQIIAKRDGRASDHIACHECSDSSNEAIAALKGEES